MAQSQALQASLYPADSIHQVSAGRLGTAPNVLLGAVTALEPDTAIGCVGLMIEGQDPGCGEVKSLFVTPTMRNRGIARALMTELERRARERGITVVRLETGIYQPESLRLYEACGWGVVPPFGHYSADPLSVFMEKTLT